MENVNPIFESSVKGESPMRDEFKIQRLSFDQHTWEDIAIVTSTLRSSTVAVHMAIGYCERTNESTRVLRNGNVTRQFEIATRSVKFVKEVF